MVAIDKSKAKAIPAPGVATLQSFPSLALPANHPALKAHAVADILGCTTGHVYDLVDAGSLCALNIAGGTNKTGRRTLRFPVETVNRFLAARAL